jgi:hypothetical protein
MPETFVIVGASLAVHFFSPRPFSCLKVHIQNAA